MLLPKGGKRPPNAPAMEDVISKFRETTVTGTGGPITVAVPNAMEPWPCPSCGTEMQFTIDMGRVEAGVGAPRPTYFCPNWENHDA